MNHLRQDLGDWGERTAAEHLVRKCGMVLLEQQWRHRHGELDLVMRKDKTLVFVEVRVRSGGGSALAIYHSVSRAKWQTLRLTACAYLHRCGWRPEAVRFDMVGILCERNGELTSLHHWQNLGIFGPRFRF